MTSGKTLPFAIGAVTAGALLLIYKLLQPAPEVTSAPTPAASVNNVLSQPAAVSVNAPVEAEATSVIVAVDNTEVINELKARIAQAEARISTLEEQLESLSAEDEGQELFQPPTPELVSNEELLNAGFDPFVVDEIKTVRDDLQLQRLELRDQATREGWLDTDRFRELSRDLRADSHLKQVLGEDDFDRLLIAEGRNNRVRVDSIINGSAADLAGLEIGDVIYRYADERIFTFGDLRRATTGGERNETVDIEVFRNNNAFFLNVPRGPLGVTVSGMQQESAE